MMANYPPYDQMVEMCERINTEQFGREMLRYLKALDAEEAEEARQLLQNFLEFYVAKRE